MSEENTGRASGETERELANDREDHERAGVVMHDEARAILRRFNASHWRNDGKERARYSIPADPLRDDDIRLGAYISRSARIEQAARAYASIFVAAIEGRATSNHCTLRLADLCEAIGEVSYARQLRGSL